MTEKEIQKLQEENNRLRAHIEYLLALLDPHERRWALESQISCQQSAISDQIKAAVSDQIKAAISDG